MRKATGCFCDLSFFLTGPGEIWGNPYVTKSVYGGKSYGDKEWGDWQQNTLQHVSTHPWLSPWGRTTRRCPVHWAAAVFFLRNNRIEPHTQPGLSPVAQDHPEADR